jgi:hypothetical protein
MSGESERRRRHEQATARGAGVRAELKEKLRTGGPQSASDLHPQINTPKVSRSEVAFQLERLAKEGEASGVVGGTYSLDMT